MASRGLWTALLAVAWLLGGCSCEPSPPAPDPCEDVDCGAGTCTFVNEEATCECPEGWSGEDCSIHDGCFGTPCANGATCVDDGAGGHTCDCLDGWTGAECTTSDGCHGDPCANGGQCDDDGAGGFTCDCAQGWTGVTCTTSDGCDGDPCANGACTDDGVGGFTCDCLSGWAGAACDQSDGCHDDPCLNDGECVDDGDGGYTCDCDPGWTGTDCDVSDGCHDAPCANGGACDDDGAGGYTCDCVDGWTGTDCDVSDGCHADPCENGGTCEDDNAGGYTCDCAEGWTGTDCDVDFDECSVDNGGCGNALLFGCDDQPPGTPPDCAPLAHSCNEVLYLDPQADSGTYTIDLGGDAYVVTCDMDLMPGTGLTLVARNDGTGLSGSAAIGVPGDSKFKLATADIDALQAGSAGWVIDGHQSGWTASLATAADLPVYDTTDPSGFLPNTWDNLVHAILNNGSVVSGCSDHLFDGVSWFADEGAASPRCWAYPTGPASFFDYTTCATSGCGQGTGATIYLVGAVYELPRTCAEVADHDPQSAGISGTYELDPDGRGFGREPFEADCGAPGEVRRDCAAFLDDDPQAVSAIYSVDAGLGSDDGGPPPSVEVWCDFDLAPGFGLTLVAANDFPLDSFPSGYDHALVPSLGGSAAIGTPYDQDHHKLQTSTIDALRGGSAFWFVDGALSGLTAVLTVDLPLYYSDLAQNNEYDSLPTTNLARGTGGCGSDRWADGDNFVLGGPIPSPSCWAYPAGSDFYDFYASPYAHPTGPQRIFVGRPAGLDLPVSCADALARDPQSQDGVYELDPDGTSGPLDPFDAWCDMTTDGGGWTLVAKMSASSSEWAYGASRWTSIGALFGDGLATAPSLTTGEAKYAAFDRVRVDEVRVASTDGRVIVPASGRSLRQVSALAAHNAPAVPDTYDDVVGFVPGNDALGICTSTRTVLAPRDLWGIHSYNDYPNGAYARARIGYAINGSNSHIWAQTAACAFGVGLEAYGPGGTMTAGTSMDAGFATVWVRDGGLPASCGVDPDEGGDLGRSIVDPDGYGGEPATTETCQPECQALRFDGVDDYVQMPTLTGDAMGVGQPWTVEGWFRLDAAPANTNDFDGLATIVTPTCGFWGVWVTPDRNLHYGRWPDACTGTTAVGLGEWHHFAGTAQRAAGTPFALYLDGQLQCSGVSTLTMHDHADVEWIQLGTRSDACLSEGNTPTQARWFFEGALKGIRISDTVRYTQAFTPPTAFTADASTRILWDMDEGVGTTLDDSAGTSHDAFVYGATWDSDGPACAP